MRFTLNGNEGWKDQEIPDKGYVPENWDDMSLEEKVEYLMKVVTQMRKIDQQSDDVLYPDDRVEEHDVQNNPTGFDKDGFQSNPY